MGITYHDAVMYMRAKRRGASFERTVTLGHQTLYLHRSEVKALQKQHQEATGSRSSSLASYQWGNYADSFLRECLGVDSLTVIDASDYEGAETVHDMNLPIPDELKNQFDAVIDCGSLEHIFNVPTVLQNLADLLTVGGTIFVTTPANNLMGHGFYQFSPELMFRVFSGENGFDLHNVTLVEGCFPSMELSRNRRLFRVANPEHVRCRVGLQSKRPAMMMVEAVKCADNRMFAKPPLQSDYVAAWADVTEVKSSNSSVRKIARRIINVLPRRLSGQLIGLKEKRTFSLKNARFYSRQ